MIHPKNADDSPSHGLPLELLWGLTMSHQGWQFDYLAPQIKHTRLKMPRLPNINEPRLFAEQLGKTFEAIYELIQMTREETLGSHSEEGCQIFDPETGPTYFQAASQFHRPAEFLACLLDMVRVMFEPHPPGTLLLNANPEFVIGEVITSPFQLGYVSVVSEPRESVAQLHERLIVPKLNTLGYDFDHVIARFLMVSTGASKNFSEVMRQIHLQYQAGLKLEQLLPRLASVVQGKDQPATAPGQSYAGYSVDPSLHDGQIRLSMWLYLPTQIRH